MDLKEKFNLYHSMVPIKQDKWGFIMSDRCDSLLFTSLVGTVPGINVEIEAAQNHNGSWARRPLELPSCYFSTLTLKDRIKAAWSEYRTNSNWTKESVQKAFEQGGSSISRDMLVGLAWYAYFNQRLDISEGVIKYALSHWCIMGKGTPTRTFMTPGLLSLYAWISYKLGGPSRIWLRYLPQFESKKVVDFEAHLSVLGIVLKNMLTGKEKFTNLLKMHASRQPQNPFFQWAAGNKTNATILLMNEQLWPNCRLPTSADRSEEWLIQRDYGKDWLPDSGPVKTYSGADFLFCANLVLNY